jgi:uncharacterized protein YheU (UPF0270 family)
MIVPHRELSDAALAGAIEEYVSRDGTELSDASTKVAAVRTALDRGELVLVYDADTDSCNIVPPDQVPPDEPDEA